MTPAWQAVTGLAWMLALAWAWRVTIALVHLGEVPDLLDAAFDPGPSGEAPALAVIVPALNEADTVHRCLRSLLASQSVRLEIFAVNDRSTDATGAVMEGVAAQNAGPHRLHVIHIERLPEGWLGKPHALARAATLTRAPFLLLTDADAEFAPDTLARALRLMEAGRADHLVLLPTLTLKSAGERMMLGVIHALGLWGPRLWKIPDPGARDSLGVGCFNLLRRSAYEAIGGLAALRMEVVEDLRLGFLVKQQGLRQRVAFGPGLLRLHWASGALGIVRGLEKNFFALCRYRIWVFAAMVGGTVVVTLGPWLGLLGPSSVRVPCLLTLIAVSTFYQANASRSRIPSAYVLLFPIASLLMLYSMIRSAVATTVRGGVRWRGSFYPLAELRRNAGPLFRL